MSISLEKINQKELITKSNGLINSHFSLSLIETQILYYAISKINPFEKDVSLTCDLKISEFKKLFNKTHNDVYTKIKNTVINRFGERYIRYFNNEIKKYEVVWWLCRVRYLDQNGYLQLKFSEEVRPFILGLVKNFTTYNIKQIIKFKSVYSIRFYEFSIMEVNRVKTKSCSFFMKISIIKEKLNIKEKYNKYKDLKRYVFEKAKEEINTYSDLIIDFKEIYQGRKVESIKFSVKRKPGAKPASYSKSKNQSYITSTQEDPKLVHHAPDKTLIPKEENTYYIKPHEIEEQDDKTKDSVKSLNHLGVNHKQAVKYVKEYGTEAVNFAIKQTVKASEKAANDGKTINNIAAYVVKCLKNSSEVLTLNSDDIHAHKQAEKEAKQKALIDRELRWIKLDRWCSEYQEQIIPIIQKHMSGEAVTDYQDYLFLKECTDTVSKYVDIIDYPLLLTDVFLDTHDRKLCFTLKSFHKILLEMIERK